MPPPPPPIDWEQRAARPGAVRRAGATPSDGHVEPAPSRGRRRAALRPQGENEPVGRRPLPWGTRNPASSEPRAPPQAPHLRTVSPCLLFPACCSRPTLWPTLRESQPCTVSTVLPRPCTCPPPRNCLTTPPSPAPTGNRRGRQISGRAGPGGLTSGSLLTLLGSHSVCHPLNTFWGLVHAPPPPPKLPLRAEEAGAAHNQHSPPAPPPGCLRDRAPPPDPTGHPQSQPVPQGLRYLLPVLGAIRAPQLHPGFCSQLSARQGLGGAACALSTSSRGW